MLMSMIALRLHIGVMADLVEILSRLEDQVANVVFDEFYCASLPAAGVQAHRPRYQECHHCETAKEELLRTNDPLD
ncbi:hypothetical protein F2Q70_00028383 [Brassica cretica]|uniref:Uncharacterized protein n=1 Tax=Brassica cretica TaxID=69181 RepID=A0A8S9L3W7_BRACR|nr:hypothetical protein F2Q70_00028383 [Brassica cretica]